MKTADHPKTVKTALKWFKFARNIALAGILRTQFIPIWLQIDDTNFLYIVIFLFQKFDNVLS